jgi:leucyl-tRNA synthetase
LVDKWLPVDMYVGGIEHAILHLLYARFFTKFLYDIGVVKFSEPFQRLFNQGMVCKLSEKTGKLEKMSKSKGNVVNPDDLVEKYGTDSVRLYELFIGPPEVDSEWFDSGITGIYRFIKKSWDMVVKVVEENDFAESESEKVLKARHKLIYNVTDRLNSFKFNTAISAFMEFVNEVGSGKEKLSRETIEAFLKLIAPFAPHFACELWQKLGYEKLIFDYSWPEYDEKYIKDDEVEIGVQVNGKFRGSIVISSEATQDAAVSAAKKNEKIQKHLENKEIKKIIYVKGRILNFIVK